MPDPAGAGAGTRSLTTSLPAQPSLRAFKIRVSSPNIKPHLACVSGGALHAWPHLLHWQWYLPCPWHWRESSCCPEIQAELVWRGKASLCITKPPGSAHGWQQKRSQPFLAGDADGFRMRKVSASQSSVVQRDLAAAVPSAAVLGPGCA